MALGNGAVTNMPNSVALGAGSVANVGALTNYIAFALAGAQNSAGEVNVGNRQITGVAPGRDDQDAVNVAQVESIAASLSSSVGTTASSIASLSSGLEHDHEQRCKLSTSTSMWLEHGDQQRQRPVDFNVEWPEHHE